MRTVTFLVLEGVDKGRVYKDLPIPVTIGREEGNGLRLNDERVSRFHAKVQVEDGDIILTVGNAGGISLELNGRALPPIGAPGAVIRELVLPADGG